MPQNLKLIGFLSVLLSCTSADAQVSFFGDLYIGGGKEVHMAFDETFFSGGKLKPNEKKKKGSSPLENKADGNSWKKVLSWTESCEFITRVTLLFQWENKLYSVLFLYS